MVDKKYRLLQEWIEGNVLVLYHSRHQLAKEENTGDACALNGVHSGVGWLFCARFFFSNFDFAAKYQYECIVRSS